MATTPQNTTRVPLPEHRVERLEGTSRTTERDVFLDEQQNIAKNLFADPNSPFGQDLDPKLMPMAQAMGSDYMLGEKSRAENEQRVHDYSNKLQERNATDAEQRRADLEGAFGGGIAERINKINADSRNATSTANTDYQMSVAAAEGLLEDKNQAIRDTDVAFRNIQGEAAKFGDTEKVLHGFAEDAYQGEMAAIAKINEDRDAAIAKVDTLVSDVNDKYQQLQDLQRQGRQGLSSQKSETLNGLRNQTAQVTEQARGAILSKAKVQKQSAMAQLQQMGYPSDSPQVMFAGLSVDQQAAQELGSIHNEASLAYIEGVRSTQVEYAKMFQALETGYGQASAMGLQAVGDTTSQGVRSATDAYLTSSEQKVKATEQAESNLATRKSDASTWKTEQETGMLAEGSKWATDAKNEARTNLGGLAAQTLTAAGNTHTNAISDINKWKNDQTTLATQVFTNAQMESDKLRLLGNEQEANLVQLETEWATHIPMAPFVGALTESQIGLENRTWDRFMGIVGTVLSAIPVIFPGRYQPKQPSSSGMLGAAGISGGSSVASAATFGLFSQD